MQKFNLSTSSLFAFGMIVASGILVTNAAKATPDFISSSRDTSHLISQNTRTTITSKPVVFSPTKSGDSLDITTKGDEEKALKIRCPKTAKRCKVKIKVVVVN
jgi:hypothetical protein